MNFKIDLAYSKHDINTKVLLKNRGLEKLLVNYFESELLIFQERTKNEIQTLFQKQSKNKACQKDYWDNLTSDQTWQEKGVYKFPKALLGKPLVLEEFKRAIPVDLDLSRINFQPKFNTPKISCKDNRCSIKVELKSLLINTNLNITNCLNEEKIIGINNFQIVFEKNNINQAIFYEADILIKKSEEKIDFILDNQKSKFYMPFGSMKFQIDGKKELLNEESDPLNITNNFINSESLKLFLLLQKVVFGEQTENDFILDFIYDIMSSLGTKELNKTIGEVLKNFDLYENPIELTIPVIPMNNYSEQLVFNRYIEETNNKINRCHETYLWAFCTFSDFIPVLKFAKNSSLDTVLIKLEEIHKEFLKLKTILNNKNDLTWSKKEKKYSIKWLNLILKYTSKIIKKINNNIKKVGNIEMKLQLKRAEFGDDYYNLQYFTSIENLKTPLEYEELSNFFIPIKNSLNYDMAVGFKLQSINNVLKWFTLEKLLDFCTNSDDSQTCDNDEFLDTTSSIIFENPPQIFRKNNHFVLKLKGAKADFKILGLPTDWLGTHTSINLEIPFLFKLKNNGRDLSFELVDNINADYDWKDTSYKSIFPRILSVLHVPIVSIILGMNNEAASKTLERGVEIIDNDWPISKFVSIEAHPDVTDEILVYFNLREKMSKRNKLNTLKEENLLQNY